MPTSQTSSIRPHKTEGSTGFVRNARSTKDQNPQQVITRSFIHTHAITIQGTPEDPAVKVTLEYNDFTEQQLYDIEQALYKVYQRFITNCLITQTLKDLITEDFVVTIQLFDDRVQFESKERKSINQEVAKRYQSGILPFFFGQHKIKNRHSKACQTLKTTGGYCIPDNVYHSIIRLPIAGDWTTCIQHEFGHSLTAPLLKLHQTIAEKYLILIEGLAESLCNDMTFTQENLDYMGLNAQDLQLTSICNFNIPHTQPMQTQYDCAQQARSVAAIWPYAMGHLLINYWLEKYTPNFADILLALHARNDEKISYLLGKFVAQEHSNFQTWLSTLFGTTSFLHQPIENTSTANNPLAYSQHLFDMIVINNEKVRNILKRHHLIQFKQFYTKLNVKDLAADKQHLAIKNAIENIQVHSLRVLEKNEWITMNTLLSVPEEQRVYFVHFAHYLHSIKATYPKAKAILKNRKTPINTPIDVLNVYYQNQPETNKRNVISLCKTLASFMHVLISTETCDRILSKQSKTTLRTAMQSIAQHNTTLTYPVLAEAETLDTTTHNNP